jgi:predicted metal-dependent hydrolase
MNLSASGSMPWNGTLVRSRLFDAISLLLPSGERFMIDTLTRWQASVGNSFDDKLRDEIDRFIREERSHQRAHDIYNRALLAECPAAAAAARRADRAADELSRLGLPARMALTAAFEQLTAVLSREMLDGRYLLPEGGSIQGRMWRWHAREELAHCHIALDAARRGGIGRARKAAALFAATAFLVFDIACCWWALCRCDIESGAGRRRMAIDAWRFAIGALPSVARMIWGWLRCLA